MTAQDEFADSAEPTSYRLVPLDRTLLTNRAVLGAVVGSALGVVTLAWSNRSDQVLAILIGLALVWLGLTAAQTSMRRRPRQWVDGALAVSVVAVGLFLVFTPDSPAVSVGRLVGAVALVVAAKSAVTRTPDAESVSRLAASSLAVAGLLLLLFPVQALSAVSNVAAAGWIAVSTIVLVVSLDARKEGVATYHGVATILSKWLANRPKSIDARQSLYAKILFDGPNTQGRIIRFFVLMGFASVIASVGVITDSTAVVIGAMLIAPLMTPLMGMAISLVMGWPNRLTRAAAVALGGIVLAIGVGLLLGAIAPAVIDTATNSQIVSRSNPTILDLLVALAAGAAGAYGLSRPEVSDALPGVAIAIALVPPLCVVGIAYSQGDWSSGNGALLLFLTNMVAILVMGGLTFIVTGVTPVARVTENQHRVKTAVAAVAVMSVLVLTGLFLNGAQVAANVFDQSQTEATIDRWLEPDHRLVQATIEGNTITAVVVGPADGLGDVEQLATRLGDALDRTIDVDVRLVVEERLTSVSDR